MQYKILVTPSCYVNTKYREIEMSEMQIIPMRVPVVKWKTLILYAWAINLQKFWFLSVGASSDEAREHNCEIYFPYATTCEKQGKM